MPEHHQLETALPFDGTYSEHVQAFAGAVAEVLCPSEAFVPWARAVEFEPDSPSDDAVMGVYGPRELVRVDGLSLQAFLGAACWIPEDFNRLRVPLLHLELNLWTSELLAPGSNQLRSTRLAGLLSRAGLAMHEALGGRDVVLTNELTHGEMLEQIWEAEQAPVDWRCDMAVLSERTAAQLQAAPQAIVVDAQERGCVRWSREVLPLGWKASSLDGS